MTEFFRELPILDTIGDESEIVKEINEGISPRLKKYMIRITYLGYKLENIPEKIILEVLRNEELSGSLIYIDIDDNHETLTENLLLNDNIFRTVHYKKGFVSDIYAKTHESVDFIKNRLPR